MKWLNKLKNNKEEFRCLGCGNNCDRIEITSSDMFRKFEKMVERGICPVVKQVKIEDFSNPQKISMLNALNDILFSTYDYYKCSKCGWGMLHKKNTGKIIRSLKNEDRI